MSAKDRITSRDKQREQFRGKSLANAQRVIQHQFEKHGFSEVFLQQWLYKYLVFIEVRALSEGTFSRNGMSKKEVTIHDALGYLHLVDPDSFDKLQTIWLHMIDSDSGTIRKFKSQPGADGKPIPIYHWINRTYKKETLAFELARATSKEYKGYDDSDHGDYDDDAGDKPDPDYARVDEESVSATLGNHFQVDESSFGGTKEEKELRAFMRTEWARLGNKGATPFDSAITRLAMSTLILDIMEKGGKVNGSEIARRLNAGKYPLPYAQYPTLRESIPEPYPISIDERKVQRLIADFFDGLRKIKEKYAREREDSAERGR
jgi:hypothetical protein